MHSPAFIQLYPTLRCNQKCSFCFNQRISASYEDMCEKDAYTLSDMLIENGCPEIDIIGGEPMLVPWMRDFVKYVTDAGIMANISTNGSLPHVVDKLSEMNTRLLNIGFSLHGFPETHNSLTAADNFSKAVTGIKRMVEKGKDPIVKSALTRENMNEIRKLVQYLKELGVQRYYLLHEDVIGRTDFSLCFSYPEFQKFYTEINNELNTVNIGFVAASGFYKYGAGATGKCDAGMNKITVMPDGSVFPCNLFAGFEEFRLGNIFQNSIEKIWGSPILEQFRTSHGNRCKEDTCSHYANCGGGCPAHSYCFYGTIDAADPRCNMK